MKNKGQLEAYVLISLFHFDLYDQFKHYVASHPEEARAYVRSLLED